MQSHVDTTTPSDLVPTDAAARQRRAATHRFVHAERPARPGTRRVLSSGITAVLLTVGIAGGAAATVTDTGAHCSGYEVGMPDGCWGTRVLPAVYERTVVPIGVR